MSEKRVPVLFIAGHGRSGSTLLGRVLGQAPGFCSAGELMNLGLHGMIENRLCGCGQPLTACPFWSAVIREAFGAAAAAAAPTLAEAFIRSVDVRTGPAWMLASLLASRPDPAQAQSRTLLRNLYRAAHRVSGATLVDTSKSVVYLTRLSEIPEIELSVVHLVRDSRAVAFSWQQAKRDPATPGGDSNMPSKYPLKSAVLWASHNTLLHLARRRLEQRGVRYLFMRYEDFAAAPLQQAGRIARWAGADPAATLGFTDSRVIRLAADHTVAGNPDRFQRGPVTIQTDSRWEKGLPVAQKVLVTAATWPLLARYGYLDESRA